jgi:hypothetical protein
MNYNRTDKYLRGLEKCVMVVTTVDPIGKYVLQIWEPRGAVCLI